MKIKHKRISSFLQARRKERGDLSLNSIDLESSQNASFLNTSDIGLSLTDRELEGIDNENGAKTARVSILDNIEELKAMKQTQSKKDVFETTENDTGNKVEIKLKTQIAKGTWILLSTAGVLAGGLIYLLRKKKVF